jgi:predicted dehydrogenase
MSGAAAVVGLGSIGRRHAANLEALGRKVLAVRSRPGPGELGSIADAAAAGATALVIATPTSEHVEALRGALAAGLHAYVEKPLAHDSGGVEALLDEAEARGLVVATGYNLRFHPALEEVKAAIAAGRIGRLLSVRAEVGQYLPDWHPGEDYRRSYAARRDLGGGALLTLTHELDLVRWIAGEVVECNGRALRVSSLELDVDDVADIVCRHASGALSSVHADFLDRAYNRRSRWVGELGTIAWEWRGPVQLLPAGETLWRETETDPSIDMTYVAALRDFLTAVENGGRPRCDGRDGLRTLELCEGVTRDL